MKARHTTPAAALVLALMAPIAVPAAAETTCIHDARVHTVTGPVLERASVCFDAGGIRHVGPRDGAPAADREVEAAGHWLTPGLIETGTGVGLMEIEMEDRTVHQQGSSADPICASFRVVEGVDPLTTPVAVARSGGITHALVVPQGGLVSGQGGLIRLRGATPSEMVVAPSTGMVMHFTEHASQEAGGSRGTLLRRYRQLVADARQVMERPQEWDARAVRGTSAHPLELEALAPVLAGALPVLAVAHGVADIDAALTWAGETGARMAILGGAGAWAIADRIAALGVPVVVDPLANLPNSFSELGARPDNAALLARAGVEVVLAVGDSHNARTLRQAAGNAVRAGMAWDDALAAITLHPARLAGMEGRLGAIAPGMEAHLALWTGDPFEFSTRLEGLWIDGTSQPLRDRQDALRDRWRQIDPHAR
jgi:imidazolonepropionase-like amidohydrolase